MIFCRDGVPIHVRQLDEETFKEKIVLFPNKLDVESKVNKYISLYKSASLSMSLSVCLFVP